MKTDDKKRKTNIQKKKKQNKRHKNKKTKNNKTLPKLQKTNNIPIQQKHRTQRMHKMRMESNKTMNAKEKAEEYLKGKSIFGKGSTNCYTEYDTRKAIEIAINSKEEELTPIIGEAKYETKRREIREESRWNWLLSETAKYPFYKEIMRGHFLELIQEARKKK